MIVANKKNISKNSKKSSDKDSIIKASSKNIYLKGTINEHSAHEILKEIMDAESDDDVSGMNIYINSGGGYVYDMFSIYDAMQLCKKTIKTFCIGKAMSAAVLILASGHKRYITSNSSVMVHEVSNGIFGKYSEMESELGETKRLQDKMIELIAKHSSVGEKEIREIFDSRKDVYLTADDVLRLGLVDKIV